jgi:hypothetical protein
MIKPEVRRAVREYMDRRVLIVAEAGQKKGAFYCCSEIPNSPDLSICNALLWGPNLSTRPLRPIAHRMDTKLQQHNGAARINS